MNKYNLQVWYYDSKCRLLKTGRLIQRIIKRPQEQSKFLFVLCPPYGGSTLLHELLSTSSQVSPNNIFGTREGQSLPEFRRLIDYRKVWKADYHFPWQDIKKVWLSYWDHSKPILLDKSPANLIRMAAIIRTFAPAYFVAMVRNPYAHCESLIRRDKMDTVEAAKFALFCLQAQQENRKKQDFLLFIRYEDLVDQPDRIKKELSSFLPEISDIEMSKSFKAHNYKNQRLKLTNLNQAKIDRLNTSQIDQINEVFRKETDLLASMGYALIVR